MKVFLNSKYIKEELLKLYIEAKNTNFKCYFKHCNDLAIQSHILQRNGILNSLTDNSHLYILRKFDFFNEKSTLKKEGLKRVLAYPLFCQKHDEEIFQGIEKFTYNPNRYIIQLLFSYRTILAELRRKEIKLKYFQNALDSTRLTLLNPEINKEYFANQVYSHGLGINDIDHYKAMVEAELFTHLNKRNYEFQIFKYKPMGICVSGMFTPISETDATVHDPDNILSNLIVNIFPHNNEQIVILGSTIHLPNKWITNYINSWHSVKQTDVEMKISNLIACHTDTWALSPSVAENNSNIEHLLSYWDNNNANFSETQNLNKNIFNKN